MIFSNYMKHITSCRGVLTVPQKNAYSCDLCGQTFARKWTLSRHQKQCDGTSYPCDSCGKNFHSKRGVHIHKKTCNSSYKSPNKTFKCRRCSQVFPNRRDLYKHKVTQHGGGDGAQNFNLVDPPWKNSQGETIDPAFEAAYTDNLTHIMAPHREGEVVKSYNYPTENLHGGVDEIMSHIEDIYENQNNSFKLNINLGFILRNRKNGAYRYHIPYGNSYLFRTPFTITRHGSLRALKNKIKRLNPAAYVENQRPNSVWELAYITNIHFDITLLDYVLGQTTTTNLPKHVKDSNSILTFTEQDDNLCFFRCMAWHQCKSQTGLEALTHRKFQTWGDYRSINTNKKFPGVKLCDIPDLENCFQVNINVFQLLEHQKVTVHYKSQSSFSDTLYLDMQGNHLSYVKDIDNYAKRYQCPRCDRLFKRYYHLKRHYSVCSKVTKYKFPGGFHKTSQTVFQELEKYGICVPQKERVFPYFITYDFEAVLQKLNNDTAKKLIWEENMYQFQLGWDLMWKNIRRVFALSVMI